MKRICLLTAGILTLSACENAAKNQSTGFSGLGSEPTVAQGLSRSAFEHRHAHSDIPSRAVRSGSANRVIMRTGYSQGQRIGLAVQGGYSGWPAIGFERLYVNTIPMLC